MENKKTLAPICLFVYSRLQETMQTIESLKQNPLASESELFIYSDGEKNKKSQHAVLAVRDYIHSITGFQKVTIIESKTNKGLANSIIAGVTEVVNTYGKVIVLEDDLIFSTNFLKFMNDALDFYEDKKRILNISGYAFDLKYPAGYTYDVAFSYRFSSWGWAIWKDRWNNIDWEMKDYNAYRWSLLKKIKFSRGGSDLVNMLYRQMHGKIDSWAIRFDYHHFKYDYLDVFPVKSKVTYNGFSSEATHTSLKTDTYDNALDNTNQTDFVFNDVLEADKSITHQIYEHYSIRTRLRNKLAQLKWKIN